MKKISLIKHLNSIKPVKAYSNKNTEFDKMFGNYTLKSFIRSLKKPIKSKRATFLDEMAEKFPYEEEEGNPDPFQSLNKKNIKLNKLYNNIFIEGYSQTENNKKSTLNSLITNNYNYKKPFQLNVTPNSCTYNPKYDCIFKKVPVITINKTPRKFYNDNEPNTSYIKRKIKLEKIPKINKTNIKIYKNNNEKKKLNSLGLFNHDFKFFVQFNDSILEEKNEKNDKNEKEEKEEKEEKDKNTGLKTIIRLKSKDSIIKTNNQRYKDNINISRNNISKLFNIQKNKTPHYRINNKNNRNLNYILKIHPHTYIKNKSKKERDNKDKGYIINFNKMISRNYDNMINISTINNPSFNRYEPKFEYITQSPKGFVFGINDNKTIYEKKKILLKKLWCSYGHLSKDYYLINNSKLNRTKDN